MPKVHVFTHTSEVFYERNNIYKQYYGFFGSEKSFRGPLLARGPYVVHAWVNVNIIMHWQSKQVQWTKIILKQQQLSYWLFLSTLFTIPVTLSVNLRNQLRKHWDLNINQLNCHFFYYYASEYDSEEKKSIFCISKKKQINFF